jgi:hypothetical protein
MAASGVLGAPVGDARLAGHRGHQRPVLAARARERGGHRLVDRLVGVVLEDGVDAGQVRVGAAPGRDHGGLEVHRLLHQLSLDGAGQPGVPAQAECADQLGLVLEGLGDSRQVRGEHAVAAACRLGEHGSQDVVTVVVSSPGHRVPSRLTYRWYVPRVRRRTQSMQRTQL